MINVTIETGYVPYSHDYMPDKGVLAFHDSIVNYDASLCEGKAVDWYCGLIEDFCGHVYQESVYSKHHKAKLSIKSSLANVQFPMSLHATYQIHTHGLAYRFREPLLPKSWQVDVQSSYLFFPRSVSRLYLVCVK